MSVAFGIEPRPSEWPRRIEVDCAYCASHRDCGVCKNTRKMQTWNYGPTISSGWSESTIGQLLELLDLPCDDFPCEWPLERFREAFRNARACARIHRAYESVRRWLIEIDALNLVAETRVYVA